MRSTLRTRKLTKPTSRSTTRALAALAAGILAVSLTACGGDDDGGDDTGTGNNAGTEPTVKLPKLDGQKLEVAAVFTGPELENFQKVLDEFEKRTGATV